MQELTGSRHRKIHYKGSAYPLFNNYVTRIIDRDNLYFENVSKKLRLQNIEHRFGLSKEEVLEVSEKAFKEITSIRKKHRARISNNKFKIFEELEGGQDPAKEDKELLEKLNANAAKAEQRFKTALSR